MTHRERFVAALNHEETDGVPLDLGGGPVSQVHQTAYDDLLDLLGLEPLEDAKEGQRLWQDVVPDERVLQRFDIDLRGMWTGQPDGRPDTLLGPLEYRDEWGVVYRKAHERGEWITDGCPLQHFDEPVPADLDSIEWPDPGDPGRVRGLREKAEQLRSETDLAIVLNLESGPLGTAQRMRGFTEILEDLLIHKPFVEALFERTTDVICGIAAAVLGEVGDLIDAITIADDLGFQTQPYMAPDLYRSVVKPHHARVGDVIHRGTDAKFVLHSDGAISTLIPDLIEAGVQVINPVQVSAAGMDPVGLKREFGEDLCFWGGIDTHRLLPFGSPSEVAEGVRRTIGTLGAGGGYVLASVHNIVAGVPPENVVAMFDTALEVRRA
jgi:uroporphyrinogen decarboxylase